ncbi:hypothetical protein LAZ67_14003110 [Cordylochernes scorpioides]|uniref:Reverse transcriptase domain-containing protein n=1 Tax=Cordylochernes scorpioides TaxID=51811 RepID=A0ABY6L7C7_9ARAC|nr:hypothetical protein LAZ67_14003110 [Cordylochernes scorpioides]
MTHRKGKKTVQIGSEKEQRWRNKPASPTKQPSNLSPQQETIFTEETPPQRTSAYPLTDRQRREQADRANDSPDIPASHGNRAAMWPKPCDKFHTFDLTSSRQCSRQQATINFTEATSVYKLYMERLQRQQEYKPKPSFLTELSHNSLADHIQPLISSQPLYLHYSAKFDVVITPVEGFFARKLALILSRSPAAPITRGPMGRLSIIAGHRIEIKVDNLDIKSAVYPCVRRNSLVHSKMREWGRLGYRLMTSKEIIKLLGTTEDTHVKLLRARTKGCYSKIRILSKTVKDLICILSQHIPARNMAELLIGITSDIKAQDSMLDIRHRNKLSFWSKKYKVPLSPQDQQQSILNLSSFVPSPDQGSRTVIMNTSDYISGMNQILSNSDIFTPATVEEHTTSNSKYKKELRTLCRNRIITTDELQGFLSNLHGQAYIYGLPKVHKLNIPLRPIVAFHLSPTAPLAQFLAKIIIPILKEGAASTSISSTPKFLDHIQKYRFMISFDVINLYPSLPHSLILECAKEFLRTHGYTADLISKLSTLISICLSNSIFNFDKCYYRQTKGTPMGSPLSSPLSEIVMRKIDSLITSHFPADIHTWFRYIDDIFCIINIESLDSIHTKLNSLFPDIQFTFEKENNCSLAFLDIMITKQNCRYITNVYYKPSFHPSYIHYTSYCPLSHKINTVKTLSKRIFTHCSTSEFKHTETQIVVNHLMNSGYPRNFILRHFYNPQQQLSSQTYRSTCIIPYSAHSVNIARYLKNKHGIRTFYTNNPKLETIVRNPITRNSFPITLPHFTNSVYSLKCSDCNSLYIGETGRRIKDRIDEHHRNIRNSEPRSLIVQHIRQTGHSFDTSQPQAYYSGITNKYRRLVVEALLSLRHNSINRHIDIPDIYNAIVP